MTSTQQDAVGLVVTCSHSEHQLLTNKVPSEPFDYAPRESRTFVFVLEGRRDYLACGVPEQGISPRLSIQWDNIHWACGSSGNTDVVGGEYWCSARNDGHSFAVVSLSYESPGKEGVQVTCNEQF